MFNSCEPKVFDGLRFALTHTGKSRVGWVKAFRTHRPDTGVSRPPRGRATSIIFSDVNHGVIAAKDAEGRGAEGVVVM